jgi:hypothetical protein
MFMVINYFNFREIKKSKRHKVKDYGLLQSRKHIAGLNTLTINDSNTSETYSISAKYKKIKHNIDTNSTIKY